MPDTARPTCRCCAKPLRKFTRTTYFTEQRRVESPTHGFVGGRYVKTGTREITVCATTPLTEAEARRRTNHAITRFVRDGDGLVTAIHTWDGESWGQEGESLFCNGRCAQLYGRAVAEHVRDGRIRLVRLK